MNEHPTRIEIVLCILLIVITTMFSGYLLQPCRPGDWAVTAGSVVMLGGCPPGENARKLLWQRTP
jgi:hypothetical protein